MKNTNTDEIYINYPPFVNLNHFNIFDKFDFIQGKDIIGNDLYYNKQQDIYSLLNRALEDENCVAVNTLGFYKKEISELRSSPYFSYNDGIYIKKSKN